MSGGSGSRRRLRHLEDLFRAGAVGDLSDGELVDRFIRCRDGAGESAFAALVERHGPMVFRVCMQALDDPHAAEDALQATFLVLARQAGTIRNHPSVSSWLFGVARRASARIRMEEARRRRFESRAAERVSASTSAQTEPPDADAYLELHAEIDRLPEKYRLPIVLCYFEGLTHDQAASRLRWPVGTVKTRLSRGRERLRSRLQRRRRPAPLSLPAGPLGPAILAELPERLVHTITHAGCRYAAHGLPGGVASSTVIELTREVTKAMLLNRLKSAVVIPGLFLLGFGVLVAAQQIAGKGRAAAPDAAITEPRDAPSTLQLHGTTDYDPAMVTTVRLPLDGRVDKVLVDLGSAIKRGQPLLEFSSAQLAAAKGDYEMAVSQWIHDKKVLDYKTPLAKENTLPKTELIDVEYAEAQSRLKMKLAKDKLLVYGLTEKESEAAKNEDGREKARMTLRALADGLVVMRDVVPGNYYETKDKLMTIAPLDHLWVRGAVSERDADKVEVGQTVRVIIPFSKQEIVSKIAYIDKAIDPETRSAKFRTTIPNPGGRYKAGMFVRLELDTHGRQDTIEAPPGPAKPTPVATTTDRLDALERKLDRLLGEAEERASHARILERLDALERKVDRLIEGRERRSP